MFISKDFSRTRPPRGTHFLQRSSQLLKAAVKSTAVRDLVTLSPSLTLLNKQKSAGARSGK
jgi:hypothetical protein